MTRKETEMDTDKLWKHITRMNWVILAALLLILVCEIKYINHNTRTTMVLSEVAQRVGVDFPTKTNNVLGVWQVVKPK